MTGNGRILMSEIVLVLDPGSSSLKFGIYRFATAPAMASIDSATPELLVSGVIDRLGSPEAEYSAVSPGGRDEIQPAPGLQPAQAVARTISSLSKRLGIDLLVPGSLSAIGCRVVHGGDRFVDPCFVTVEVAAQIRDLKRLAPLHNPPAADVLEACLGLLPHVPVVAVFDTMFHRTMPAVARTYALPREVANIHGIHRFGFHGIAHGYVSAKLILKLRKTAGESRCITCHLGNGASICAVLNGKSIDTSMGMTPMEGLVMGTRSGDVDPGILVFLQRELGMSVDSLDDLLNHKSGLLGVSSISSDVRDLESAIARGDVNAQLAIDLFVYRAAKQIGAYAVALDGLDGLAFSGGVGEHAIDIRQRICRQLRVLGVDCSAERNASAKAGEESLISSESSKVAVWVIPADEDIQIANEVMNLRATATQ